MSTKFIKCDECGKQVPGDKICQGDEWEGCIPCYQWTHNIEIPVLKPYVGREENAGPCEDCGRQKELAEDKICHYCYHTEVPEGECWCDTQDSSDGEYEVIYVKVKVKAKRAVAKK